MKLKDIFIKAAYFHLQASNNVLNDLNDKEKKRVLNYQFETTYVNICELYKECCELTGAKKISKREFERGLRKLHNKLNKN
jgi:hypothetical protein